MSAPKETLERLQPVVVDLDPWLDAAVWPWYFPKPLDLRGGDLVADVGDARSGSFQPALLPWLVTEFTDGAATLDSRDDADAPPLAAIQEAVKFAKTYGLTDPWSGNRWSDIDDPTKGPPRFMPVADLLRQSWDLRQALLGYRDLIEPTTEPFEGDDTAAMAVLQAAREATLEGGPLGLFFREAVHLLLFRVVVNLDIRGADVVGVRPELSPSFNQSWGLLALMKLQLLADVLGARPVNQCQRCGKFFVWSRGRASEAPMRAAGMRGRVPKFCSYSHAQAQHREDRARQGGGS